MALSAPTVMVEAVATSTLVQTRNWTLLDSIEVGETMIVWCGDDGSGGTWTVTDDGGNAYTPCHPQLNNADNYNLRAFYSVLTTALPSGGSVTTTKTGGAGGTWDLWCAAEKVTTALELDQAVSLTGSGTAWSGGTTPDATVNDVLAVGGASLGGAAPTANAVSTPGSGWFELHDEQGGSFVDFTTVYRIESVGGAYTASGTWGFTDLWAADTLIFREVVLGPPPPIMIQYQHAMNAMKPSHKGYR